MKIIVISDIHLTNSFEPKKFELLSTLFTNADKIILNGDIWDGHINSFDQFLSSQWNSLFPLMKAKTIYVYGNHDLPSLSDKRVSLFSHTQSTSYDLRLPAGEAGITNYHFHIEHGNKFMPPQDIGQFPTIFEKILSPLSHLVHHTAVRMFGPRFYNLYQFANNRGKRWAQTHLTKNTILVCGHTHLREDDRAHQFINTGFVLHGYASWLEINDDSFGIKTERY